MALYVRTTDVMILRAAALWWARSQAFKIKESVLKELLTKKKTEVISGFVSKTGMKFDAPLKLTEDGNIAFDFPEKPKPIETNVLCPKCGRPLKKTQWKYEC